MIYTLKITRKQNRTSYEIWANQDLGFVKCTNDGNGNTLSVINGSNRSALVKTSESTASTAAAPLIFNTLPQNTHIRCP